VAGRERLVCDECDFIFYLNPKVAAGVLVEDDDRVILIRRGIEPKRGFWALPSGFVELDESAEEAAVRECQEETSLEVALDDLLGVYSFQSLVYGRGVLILYSAHVVGGEMAAGDDAADVAAFSPEEVPPDIAFRTHRQALRDWKRAKAVTYRPVTPEETECLEADYPKEIHISLETYTNGEDDLLLGAIDGDQIVGFTGIHFPHDERVANLDLIFVAPPFRRWGIGTALIHQAMRIARDRGLEAIVTQVSATNPGLAIFLKIGFRVCGFEQQHFPPGHPGGTAALFLVYDLV
jgi:ADP-ribose pyrophosphatase YjhB (NUDIX family)/GNAT superfamily N-acetyltransferase